MRKVKPLTENERVINQVLGVRYWKGSGKRKKKSAQDLVNECNTKIKWR